MNSEIININGVDFLSLEIKKVNQKDHFFHIAMAPANQIIKMFTVSPAEYDIKKYSELAEKNVGYGQMGNMSVTIYSNGKDEVLVGSSIESYLDNKAYYEKNPDKIDKQWKKEVKDAENFIRTIEEGKFKRLGEISLSVWRWMCMDKKLMEEHGEKVAGEYSKKYYSEHVPVKLKSGKYRIDHFFDFPKNGDYLYSRIKLIN